MAYEQKDNTGALFGAKNKKTEKHPDYTGQALVNGQQMWISGWRKTSEKGTAYLSLKFEIKEETAKTVPQSAPAKNDIEEDDLPF